MRNRRLLLWEFGAVVLAALLLACFAFYNKFPLLYPDTGTYVECGFQSYVPSDRPFHYGFFIRHISLAENVWFVILGQCLLLAGMLRWFCTRLTNMSLRGFLILIIVLVTLTGVSLPAGQLVPDIFTPILILTLLGTIFIESKSKGERIGLIVIGIICGVMHMSHLLLLWLTLGVVGVLVFMRLVSRRTLVPILIVSMGSTLMIPIGHVLVSDKFEFVPKGYLFHLNRLVATGVLDDFLETECKTADYKLCQYKDSIPTNFLWNQKKSPLHILGGWHKNEEEYREIVRRIHLNPKYWLKMSTAMTSASFSQFFNFGVFDMRSLGDDRVVNIIGRYFPHQKREAQSAFQVVSPDRIYSYGKRLDFCQRLLIPFCFICIIYFWHAMNSRDRLLIIILLLILFFNAMVSGGLSTVVPRYQNRVMWLVVVPVFMYMYARFISKKHV